MRDGSGGECGTSTLHALWVVYCYPSERNTFPGAFYRTQVEALQRCGATVQVCAPLPWVPPFFDRLSEKWRDYASVPREEMIGGVQVLRPRYLALPRESTHAMPHLMIRQACTTLPLRKPDVIHAHSAYPQGIVALELGRRWQVPVVLTLHGTDVNEYPTLNPLCRRRFHRAVQRAHGVITVSRALAARTQELTGRYPVTMPIGIQLAPYRHLPDKATARRELGLPEDQFLVLFAGRLTRAKGIHELTLALKQLQHTGVSGVLVGPGDLLGEVQRVPNIVTTGLVRNDRIPHFLAAADALILPSYSEGMPTVLVEAGAAGVPVIATRIGGIEELLAPDRGYLLESPSVAHIVQTITHVREHYAEALARAQRLHQFVTVSHDVDTNARDLVALYTSLMGRELVHSS